MATQRITAPPATSSLFLTFEVHSGAEDELVDFLTGVSDLVRAVDFRNRDADLNAIVGIGDPLWDRLFTGARPKHLHPFREVVGSVHTAISTQDDLLIHLRCRRPDMAFEAARLLTGELDGIATVTDEVHGFVYFDERDLLGFVDGTANPEGEDSITASVIGDDDVYFAGGSYVIVQKYLHDMAAWDALSTEEQEGVIGRTKLDDVELPDDIKPTNSHVALTDLPDGPDGSAREIVRMNMPFGRLGEGEFGTYFIGFAADPTVTEDMLDNMFIGDPPGNYDRILDFSEVHTGGLYFVLPKHLLDGADELPRATVSVSSDTPAGSRSEAGSAGAGVVRDGSLGVGKPDSS